VSAAAVEVTRTWCSLDDRAALPNYLARGFRAYHAESYSIPVDESHF
jgi:hypothetical protein